MPIRSFYVLFLFFKAILIYYLKVRTAERERERKSGRKRGSICWIAPWSNSQPGPCLSKELLLGFLHGWQGSKNLGCYATFHGQRAGSEVGQLGFELVPTLASTSQVAVLPITSKHLPFHLLIYFFYLPPMNVLKMLSV